MLLRRRLGVGYQYNDISQYISTKNFLELDYLIARKLNQGGGGSHLIESSHESIDGEISIEIHTARPITKIPKPRERSEILFEIQENFKKKYS